MTFHAFIENEAGSNRKNHHDEKALTFQRSETVSSAYPYPYGFIIGMTNVDGDCIDCFVITNRALHTGEIVECEAIGLMEQTEDGLSDHNVLAQLAGEHTEVTADVRMILAAFVQNVFSHIPGKQIGVGKFLGATEAEAAIQACVDCVRPTLVDVRTESFANLSEHAKIPIAFTVQRVFEIDDGPAGVVLTERVLDAPYVKDYDAHETPMQWATRFDLSRWGLLGAYVDDQRVGGTIVAFDTPGLNLLDGRTDLALLWDIRVRPEHRQQGVGSTLFRAVEEWARSRGCHDLTVETQNVNVPACRFYQRQGCVLRAVNHAVYREFPEEIQLLWYKELPPSGHARTGTEG